MELWLQLSHLCNYIYESWNYGYFVTCNNYIIIWIMELKIQLYVISEAPSTGWSTNDKRQMIQMTSHATWLQMTSYVTWREDSHQAASSVLRGTPGGDVTHFVRAVLTLAQRIRCWQNSPHFIFNHDWYTAIQSQKAVSAYLTVSRYCLCRAV